MSKIGPASNPPRRVKIPAGLMGMLAVVLVVEAILARRTVGLIPATPVSWKLAGSEVTSTEAKAPLLCFGDSFVKMGIVPLILGRKTGLESYNLAVIGGHPSLSYFLVRRALEAGSNPRAIVVDAASQLLMFSNPRESLREWSEVASTREILELATVEEDYGLLGPLLLSDWFPSIRNRPEVRAYVKLALAGQFDPQQISQWMLQKRQAVVNRGGFFLPSKPKDAPDGYPGGKLGDVETYFYYPYKWAPRIPNLKLFDRFLDLACQGGRPVFFLIPPMHPSVQLERERRGIDASYGELIRRVQARHPSMVVVDGRHAGFLPCDFFDPVHLSRGGALTWSEQVGAAIADSLGGSGRSRPWVVLNPSAPDQRRPATEDVSESGLALKNSDRTVR